MNYLSVCAILKNEGPYLVEWVSHYLKQGVEHFYLYDNNSDDSPREVLKEFEQFITWHDMKGPAQQKAAYNHCIKTYRNKSKWAAFLDADEFIFSARDKVFAERLSVSYDRLDVSGVAVHWLIFGSSGHVEYSPEPVTKRFTMRAKEVNPHVKSVMRLSDTHCVGNNVHTFRADDLVIDENHLTMPREYAVMAGGSTNILVLNHYHTKSFGEYKAKRLLPKADSGQMVDFQSNFDCHNCNDVEDKRIWEVL